MKYSGFNKTLVAVGLFICFLAALTQRASASISGAIYTTTADGTIVNQNSFATKPEVYLNGGPQNENGGGLSPLGTYYYQVTDPSGSTLLSTDPASCRQVVVAVSPITQKGVIHGVPAGAAPADCTSNSGNWHAVGGSHPITGSIPVQLIPFNDTPNGGGVYKVWLISKTCAAPLSAGSPTLVFNGNCDTKTDNFKVAASTPAGTFTVVKRCLVGDQEVTPLGPAFQFSMDSTALLSCGGSDPQVINTFPQSKTVKENSPAAPPDPPDAAFGWELRDIKCTDDGTGDTLGSESLITRMVSVEVSDSHKNVTCTFTNAQARMPLHKLVNGASATCTDDPATPDAETGDAGIRPCTYPGLTLNAADPRFTVNLYLTAGGLPLPIPPAIFPDGFAAQAKIPPVFEAPGLIGVPLTLCEVPALPYTLDSVSIQVTDSNSITTTLNPAPAVYTNSGYSCFNILIPSGTTRFEISINNTVAKLKVIKACVPTTDTGKFNLLIDSTTQKTDAACGEDTGFVDVTIGSHTVSELAGTGTSLSDYTSAISGDCDADGNVTLAAGNSKTCTITNTRKPRLSLKKVVVNDNGGTANASAWTLAANGTSLSFSGNGAPATGSPATLGPNFVTIGVQYTLSESGGPSGYSASDWSCNGGTFVSPNKVTLAAGDNVTCTITNDDIAPKLHLRKVLVGGIAPVTATSFTLTADGTGSNDVSGTTPVDSLPGLLADTWTLSETGPAGYTKSDWVCVGGTYSKTGTVEKIQLGIGGEATCTITNRRNSTTVTQGGWGAKPSGNNPGTILNACWPSLYPSPSYFVIGGTFTLTITTPDNFRTYMAKATGTPGVLDASVTNPTKDTKAGIFGAQVAALKLNVDISANKSCSTNTSNWSPIGGWKLKTVGDGVTTRMLGLTITQVLAIANQVLGGNTTAIVMPSGPTPQTLAQLGYANVGEFNVLVTRLNEAFDQGVPTAWAIAHLE